jgi:DNA-directed RNA polymerase subunit RPC12/RpoP
MGKKINIDKEKLVELHSSGISNSAIARLLGCSYPTIGVNLRSIGLQSNTIPSVINIGDPFSCVSCGNILGADSYEKQSSTTYRITCKKCRNKSLVVRRFSTIDNRISKKIISAKSRSNKSCQPFNINVEYMKELLDRQNGKCFYTDEKIIFYKYGETPTRKVAPSVDKIIPNLGYVKGNVVWCLDRINLIKNDTTLDEMKIWMPEWYRRIVENESIYKF